MLQTGALQISAFQNKMCLDWEVIAEGRSSMEEGRGIILNISPFCQS
ncbi:MAG: hypothetical protein QNJ38_20310 [Prochloraceae cyanobacterium]|nr:hypothetical protein [Prochloraceae cyanobacterium]